MERPIWDEAFDDNASGDAPGVGRPDADAEGALPSGHEGRTPSLRDYDWINDAFDDAKPDPLASKGMTGCSSLAVLLAVIAVVAIVAIVAFALGTASLFATTGSL